DDTIRLDDAAIAGLGPRGELSGGRFRIGGAAADADDRVIYDEASGRLFYDADGVGGAAQVRIARLDAGLDLTRHDFLIVWTPVAAAGRARRAGSIVVAPVAAPVVHRLIGDAAVIFAIGQRVEIAVAAEVEILGGRIPDRPLAHLVVEAEQRHAKRDRHRQILD